MLGYTGKDFVATINPAPLNMNLFSGIAAIKNNCLIMKYVVRGEAIEVFDAAAADTYTEKVGRIVYVCSNGGYNPISAARN